MSKLLMLAVAVMGLAGCATTPEEEQAQWDAYNKSAPNFQQLGEQLKPKSAPKTCTRTDLGMGQYSETCN